MDLKVMSAAIDALGARLKAVGSNQWTAPTPCSDWDVRALANHVVGELLWIPPLVEGKTIAEVGNQFDGDILGADPVATFTSAAAKAQAAAAEPGALDRIVHLSFGDLPAHEYLGQVTSDVIIHTWDLAKAIGADDRTDPALFDFVVSFITPQIEMWRSPGVFAKAADAAADADAQDRFIALTGRDPNWTA